VKHKNYDDQFKCCTSSGLSETGRLSNEDMVKCVQQDVKLLST